MSQGLSPELLKPQWFIPMFASLWLGVNALLAVLSGWIGLAAQFRASDPIQGQVFRFASGAMGTSILPVSYGSCLFITVNQTGFGLAILFLFRFLSPPLFIPWRAVESIETKRFLLTRRTVIRLRGHWATVSVRGAAGRCIQQAYAAAGSQKAP
jgi:hypothetical protein